MPTPPPSPHLRVPYLLVISLDKTFPMPPSLDCTFAISGICPCTHETSGLVEPHITRARPSTLREGVREEFHFGADNGQKLEGRGTDLNSAPDYS